MLTEGAGDTEDKVNLGDEEGNDVSDAHDHEDHRRSALIGKLVLGIDVVPNVATKQGER